jgi:ferric-dicitrate binding protein FerR (iron transport regulator)
MEDQTRFSDPELDDAALARYLCGESDATERQWIEQRVHLSEVARHELTSARTAWLASGGTPQKGNIEQFVKRLRAAQAQHRSRGTDEYRLDGLKTESGPSSQRHGNQRFKAQPLRRGVRYALAGAMVGILAIIVGQHISPMRLGAHRALPMSMSTYVTGNGERANITLPDGNTVALNVASRLEVPADYLAGDHTLRLTGEALFTVQHHDRTPFTVIAGPATTRVLGTSFLLRYYATDSSTTVVVREGKVAVHSAAQRSVVLTAARQIQVVRTGSSGVQVADTTQFSFATGILTLKSVPFPNAIAELDRWYDADIRLGDPVLKARRVTGESTAGSLSELTEILAVTFNVRVVRSGRVLTLYPK